jgi:hypothetical protein
MHLVGFVGYRSGTKANVRKLNPCSAHAKNVSGSFNPSASPLIGVESSELYVQAVSANARGGVVDKDPHFLSAAFSSMPTGDVIVYAYAGEPISETPKRLPLQQPQASLDPTTKQGLESLLSSSGLRSLVHKLLMLVIHSETQVHTSSLSLVQGAAIILE